MLESQTVHVGPVCFALVSIVVVKIPCDHLRFAYVLLCVPTLETGERAMDVQIIKTRMGQFSHKDRTPCS